MATIVVVNDIPDIPVHIAFVRDPDDEDGMLHFSLIASLTQVTDPSKGDHVITTSVLKPDQVLQFEVGLPTLHLRFLNENGFSSKVTKKTEDDHDTVTITLTGFLQ